MEGDADDRLDEVEEASWRMVRLVEAASLRFDDLRLVRQVRALLDTLRVIPFVQVILVCWTCVLPRAGLAWFLCCIVEGGLG